MSSTATRSGASRARRCATRAPRSWLAKAKVAKPSASISASMSPAIARLLYAAWSPDGAGLKLPP
jgi:hypothetical protein